jgi:type I restriction enzyme, S subunit
MNFGVNLVPLSELGEIVSGSTPDTSNKEYWGGDIPWITPADLTDHTGIYFRGKLRKITRAGYDSCSTKLLPMGAIIYSSRAPIGHCAVTTFPLCTNQGFKSIIPNEKLNSVYGFFALRFFTPQIVAQGRGATFAEINKEIFENFHIPLPTLSEQKRIAFILEKADRLCRQRHFALELSNTYLQSVFLEMFGDPAENPMKWDLAELSYVCDEIYRYPTFYGFQYTEKGTPVARIGNILSDGRLNPNLSDYVFIDPEISKRFPRTILELNDIVMAVRGDGSTVSRIGIVDSSNLIGANISPNLLLFRAKKDVISPMYLFHLMVSDAGQNLLEMYITRTAKKTITAQDIKQIKIPMPRKSLQEKFAQIVQKFERLRTQQREAERQAEHLFQTLLHQAFQGNVDLGIGGVQNVQVEYSLQSSAVDSQHTGSFVQLQMNY